MVGIVVAASLGVMLCILAWRKPEYAANLVVILLLGAFADCTCGEGCSVKSCGLRDRPRAFSP